MYSKAVTNSTTVFVNTSMLGICEFGNTKIDQWLVSWLDKVKEMFKLLKLTLLQNSQGTVNVTRLWNKVI